QGNSDDLIIQINGTSDQLTVQDQFDARNTGPFGLQWFDRIEAFTFEDASYFDWNEVLTTLVSEAKTAGDDTIYGFYYQDTLDGGAGDDYLSGGDDNDTYIFDRGYGADTIREAQTNVLTASIDTVLFGAGILPTDVIFDRIGTSEDLLISFVDDASTLTIERQFSASYTGPFGTQWFNRIENFQFADANQTVITATELFAPILAKAKTTGDDQIYGFDVEDVLDGGAGNDFLSGGNENDTYIFGRGYGTDTIDDGIDNILSGGFDIVSFNSDVAPDDIILSRGVDDDDLQMNIAGTSDTLIIRDTFKSRSLAQSIDYIEEFRFSDGTVWTLAEVGLALLDIESTDGDDFIRGFSTQDRLDGGLGNDLLQGWDGGDTYVFGLGYGQDTIFDNNQNAGNQGIDIIEFTAGISLADLSITRDGNDLLISINDTSDSIRVLSHFNYGTLGSFLDIEELRFSDGSVVTQSEIQVLMLTSSDGDDILIGAQFSDVLDGGLGNDRLEGGDGSDTYIFDVGYGNDVINDRVKYVNFADNDKIVFGPGITPANIELNRVGSDLIISVAGFSDTLTIESHFSNLGYNLIETFEFADGTVWSAADVAANLISENETPGDDFILGTPNDDVLDGGLGDDVLTGMQGSDTYIFGRGYGQDVIDEFGGSSSNGSTGDKVQFIADIVPADIILSRIGSDLVLQVDGTSDQLTIQRQFFKTSSLQNNDRIESFEFADGTIWTAAEVEAQIILNNSTGLDDYIQGYASQDLLDGGAGNDVLTGESGADTYIFGRGY
ncbi:MAG: hypothetical protein L3J79_10940, partial [Candidatus Marinimicrobia bacterium]|nr:hypothetical protein [Candidatus Neomarinimicrobiota bacterium]